MKTGKMKETGLSTLTTLKRVFTTVTIVCITFLLVLAVYPHLLPGSLKFVHLITTAIQGRVHQTFAWESIRDFDNQSDTPNHQNGGEIHGFDNRSDTTNQQNGEEIRDFDNQSDTSNHQNGGEIRDFDNQSDTSNHQNGGEIRDFENQSDTSNHQNGGEIRILWYNKPKWYPSMQKLNEGIQTLCNNKQCKFTEDTKHMANHSAVIFSLQDKLNEQDPQLMPSNRNPDQPWMFFHGESPINLVKHATWYRHEQWLNTMNWSMTYRLDSDVYFPFAEFLPTQVEYKNFSAIFRKKDKFAAWIVSHCNTEGKREQYVKQLQNLGIPVDIYGHCSGRKLEKNISHVSDVLRRHYKFYLSFENSLCKDYVTEKLYMHYNNDIVLVARGGADYTKRFPNGTYINTSDFPTIKELAQYLLRLNSSESMYTKYLERKNAYPFRVRDHGSQILHNSCYICEKVKDAYKYRKLYVDINPYLFENRCRDPTDV